MKSMVDGTKSNPRKPAPKTMKPGQPKPAPQPTPPKPVPQPSLRNPTCEIPCGGSCMDKEDHCCDSDSGDFCANSKCWRESTVKDWRCIPWNNVICQAGQYCQANEKCCGSYCCNEATDECCVDKCMPKGGFLLPRWYSLLQWTRVSRDSLFSTWSFRLP